MEAKVFFSAHLQVRVRQEPRQPPALRIHSDEHFDQQNALHGEAVGAFGGFVLLEIHVQNRVFGGEQEATVARLQKIQSRSAK